MINEFIEIYALIKEAKYKSLSQVNSNMIELYWNIGEYVHYKVLNNEWGKSVVVELAKFIKTSEPNIQGFSDRNIWRMKQFYETYSNPEFLKLSAVLAELPTTNNKGKEMLSPLTTEIQSTENKTHKKLPTVLAEINWSLHLEIIACKSNEEKLFYLIKAKQERWSFRELKRQIATATFERTMLANEKIEQSNLSATFNLKDVFRDTYVLEFLSLQALHNETELQKAIVTNIKNFILELDLHFSKGSLFENLVITELMKRSLNQGRKPQFYFWRDTAQHEIDLLVQNGVELEAIEIKSEKTIQPEHFKGLNYLKKINPSINSHLIYGGEQFQKRSETTVYGFNHLSKLNF